MNFELNQEQRAYQEAAREFAQKEMTPHAARWDEEAYFPREIFSNAGALGFCGLYAHPDYGGLGLTRLDSALIFEELAQACPSTAAFFTIHNMATWMVTQFAQKQVAAHWGTLLTSGAKLASYCLTEPGAGSDAASLKTTAQKTQQGYLLNGSKAFISGAGATDVLIVMARSSASRTGGISAFVVDAKTQGINYGKQEKKMGWNSQPTRTINFDQVRVPLENLLGNEGEGFKIAMQGLDGGRINIATCSVGAAQSCLNLAQAYMHTRKQFGKTLAEFQALQFKLADMATHLVAARQMVRLAASKLDIKHADTSAFCAMAKRFATDMGFDICNQALQIHGGYGYLRDFPLERYVRDARVHQILEGTNEVMRLIIAKRVLQQNLASIE